MTLQSTASAGDPLTFREIIAEFGNDASISLLDYYRGGSYVPSLPVTVGIPSSGTIRILDFLGKSVAGWQDADVYFGADSGVNPGAASCSFQIQADGTYDASAAGVNSQGTFTDHLWRGPGSTATFYTYSTLITGTTPTGTFNSWVSTASDRGHTLISGSGDDKEAIFQVKLSTTASDAGLISTIEVDMYAFGAGNL